MSGGWWRPALWCAAAHLGFWCAWMALSDWRYGGAGPVEVSGELGWAVACLVAGCGAGVGSGAWLVYRTLREAPWWALVPGVAWGLSCVWLGALYGWVALVFLGA